MLHTIERHNNVKEGYMFVANQSMWKTFSLKAKYFILTDDCLYCFKRRGDLTSIPHDVICLDDIGISVSEERRGLRRRYCIKLTSSQSRKSYTLFCFALEERDAWFTSIMSVLASKYTEHLPSSNKARTVKNFDRKSKLLMQQRSKSISCIQLTDLDIVSKDFGITPIQDLLDIPDSPLQPIRIKKKYSSSSLDLSIFYSLSQQTSQKKRHSLIPFLSDKIKSRKSKFRSQSCMNLDDTSSSDEGFSSSYDVLNEKKKLKRKKYSLGRK